LKKVHDTDGPNKTLRGFKKVEDKAGKTSKVTIELDPSAFEFFDRNQNKMAVTPGEYEVFSATSSDIRDLKLLKIKL